MTSPQALLRRIRPVALCAALVAVFVVWNPQVHDLAAHVLRAELFERAGLAIWNGSWFQGHYTLTYSVLFPPLAAWFSPQAVGAVAVVGSALLFDRLVRSRWGEAALWGSLWFAFEAARMYANANLTFALGAFVGLAALLGLSRGHTALAAAAALLCTLASPLAGAFLAGVAGVIAIVSRSARRPAAATLLAALIPALLLSAVFHEEGVQPFDFIAYVPIALWCAGAYLLIRRFPGERGLRVALVGYALVATAFVLVESPMGSNVSRLGTYFGGPVLLCVLLAHRDEILPDGARLRRALTVLVACLTLGWAAYWQLDEVVDAVLVSQDDRSTAREYFEPLNDWLRAHEGEVSRIEIPETENRWESAYVAPDFQLARGWLRQMDRARNELFYEGELTPQRYHGWLRETGVRYVALADAEPWHFSREERELILSEPPFLELAWESEHWRVWEVEDATPLVSSEDGGVAEIAELEPESVTLAVEEPGTFTVLVRASAFWHVAEGEGCASIEGDWTEVRADAPGLLRIENSLSIGRAWDSLTRTEVEC